MKQFPAFLLFVLFSICIFSSCKNSNSPQAVTEKFLTSVVQADFDKAKALSTKNTWGMLDIWAAFTKEIPENVKAEKAENFKVKILDTKTESDSTVIVTYSTEPKILPFNKIRLQKELDIEGRIKWKVDISTLELGTGDELYINAVDSTSGIRLEMERQSPDTISDKQENNPQQ
ncbi:DUF4878 domain-containing protein [Taibaiella lutea]|uniref:DUF4878 domain-containing protein n=1 Tax=Taibaiella lutea TaxID=2608001 RepID=A0A5M6CDS1_9BACT|nr:DUF4878 domain-containing protein [Taibaiella lutea]KAA5533123.1 DUF4878 domain-containing protein [Taibaiella lutea]